MPGAEAFETQVPDGDAIGHARANDDRVEKRSTDRHHEAGKRSHRW